MWYLLRLQAKAATHTSLQLHNSLGDKNTPRIIWISCRPWHCCPLCTPPQKDRKFNQLPIHVENIQSPRLFCYFDVLFFCFLLRAWSCTCTSAGASASVLWWRASEVVAHTAIRSDGSVRERACVWCEPDSTEGVFNRACGDRWHAFITAWWVNTRERLLPALSIKPSSALLSLDSHWPAKRLVDQLRQGERRGVQLFCGPRLARHVPNKRYKES